MRAWADAAWRRVPWVAPREPGVPAWVHAIEAGDAECVRHLAFDVNDVWEDHRSAIVTPLALALCWLNAPMVEMLLDRGADPNGPLLQGWTPIAFLMRCVRYADPSEPTVHALLLCLAQLLLQRGATLRAALYMDMRVRLPERCQERDRPSREESIRARPLDDGRIVVIWLLCVVCGAVFASDVGTNDLGWGILWGAAKGGFAPFVVAGGITLCVVSSFFLPFLLCWTVGDWVLSAWSDVSLFALPMVVAGWMLIALGVVGCIGVIGLMVSLPYFNHVARIEKSASMHSPLDYAVLHQPLFVTLFLDHGARLEDVRPKRVRHAILVQMQRTNTHVDRRLLRMIFAHYVWPARHHIVPSVSVATNVRATCFNAPPSVQPGIVVRATSIAREVCDAWMAENEAE